MSTEKVKSDVNFLDFTRFSLQLLDENFPTLRGVASENSNLNKYFFLWYFYELVFSSLFTLINFFSTLLWQ